MNVQVRGFRKPNKSMKLIVDKSITPREQAEIKYRKLYEQTMIRKSEKLENIKRDYLQELKQFIKQAL